uniref:Uncharacterized protein n=1 Tax=Arundo donax TaxID=35708 RepID=A0A0A8YW49_ARUDO
MPQEKEAGVVPTARAVGEAAATSWCPSSSFILSRSARIFMQVAYMRAQQACMPSKLAVEAMGSEPTLTDTNCY